jgi:ribosomal protein S18 acetylase RimI-like enzyme
MSGLRLESAWIPGAVGDIAALHGRHYAASHGMGVGFEGRVAGALGAFLEGMDERSLFRCVVDAQGQVLGSIVIDGSQSPLAQLRWFILDASLRGQGWGRRLMQAAMDHAQQFSGAYLYTMDGLDAAIHLYRAFGFNETARVADAQWNTPIVNIRMEWHRG